MAFSKKTWKNKNDTGASKSNSVLNADNMNDLETRIANELTDTGWINLPLAEGIEVGTIIKKAQYRRVGKLVYLRGDVKGINNANTLIATLPTGFRPSTQHYFLNACSGTRFTRIFVATNGNINLEWVSDSNYGSTWHSIDTCFLVD